MSFGRLNESQNSIPRVWLSESGGAEKINLKGIITPPFLNELYKRRLLNRLEVGRPEVLRRLPVTAGQIAAIIQKLPAHVGLRPHRIPG